MPVYSIKRRGGTAFIGHVETSPRGRVKAISRAHQWAVGKDLATFSEWCHRKELELVRLTDKSKVAAALVALHPQGELELT